MTSRERVLRAIEKTGPDRVPLHFCNRDFDLSDTFSIGVGQKTGFIPSVPGMTEWGYIWSSLDMTMGQPHGYPLADPERIASYVPPDPFAHGRFEHMEMALQECGNRFSRLGIGFTGFNQVTFLRGFEAFLEDLYCEPERAEKLLDIAYNYENSVIEQSSKFELDCICFGDDWGTQQGLIISPAKWREVFKPRYKEQFDMIHKQGRKIWFHSCGNVYSIIPDFIEIGVDVIELLQPDVFGVEKLGKEFGGDVCFCCSVDHQRRAVTGSRQEIFDYTRLLRDKLGCFNGGYIGYIEYYNSLGMTEETYNWICEAFQSL